MERALVLHRSERALTELVAALGAQIPCDTARDDDEAVARLRSTDYVAVVVDHAPPARDARTLVDVTLR